MLRVKLGELRLDLLEHFENLVVAVSPALASIEVTFPHFTRHDPSHNLKLEEIAVRIMTSEALSSLTAEDLFILLCALWIHDAGMGDLPHLRKTETASHEYRTARAADERLGLSEDTTWQAFARKNHHRFCPSIVAALFGNTISNFLVHAIGKVARSHGERDLHDPMLWQAETAVGEGVAHLSFVASVLRIADILHFNEARAPEYMLEHRNIRNQESELHWRAHQVAAGIVIADDICSVDGVALDDEAYWFAAQFTDAMADELSYVQRMVFPQLPSAFRNGICFHQVYNRIIPQGFLADAPVQVRVEPEILLNDLLSKSLYGNKPLWFREVLQNAFDACRDLQDLEPDANPVVTVSVDTSTRTLTIADNGIGMRQSTVENYLLVAGASYWRSNEYLGARGPGRKHVGHFGIGFISILSIAETLRIVTRFHSAPDAFSFLIRSARRVVRVESHNRILAGTEITVQVSETLLSTLDFAELIRESSPLPEFPITLTVDGVLTEFPAARTPDERGTYALHQVSDSSLEVTIASGTAERPGLKVYWAYPKYKSRTLGAYLPGQPSMFHSAGWRPSGESFTAFGGIKYPVLHTLEGDRRNARVPSLGILRLMVSPQNYPLEMNLARERFLRGPGCETLLDDVVAILDEAWTADCRDAIGTTSDWERSSAIVAAYSHAMLHLTLGGSDEFGLIHNRTLPPAISPPEQWRRFNELFVDKIYLGLLNRRFELEFVPLRSAVESGLTVFAIGTKDGRVPTAIARSIFDYCPEARLLLALPWHDLGIKALRHWAAVQHLVPIDQHSRSAFGVTLAVDSHPYPYAPGKGDWFSLGSCSGPREFAVLDYRDFMAEAVAASMQSGGPQILGILNYSHPKIAQLIEGLPHTDGPQSFRNHLRFSWKNLVSALVVGNHRRYEAHARQRLCECLNVFAAELRRAGHLDHTISFVLEDLPAYFDGGTAIPFGTPAVLRPVKEAIEEAQPFEFSLSQS